MWIHSLLASWQSGRSRGRRQPAFSGRKPRRSTATRLALEQLEDRCLPSSYTATNAAQLAADITAANAAGGANTITLTAPTSSPYGLTAGLSIAANDDLTIVGNNDTIEGPVPNGEHGIGIAVGASLTLENLTLQNFESRELGQGVAIYNQGVLTLSAVTVRSNGVLLSPTSGVARGGAIWSNGSLTLENGTLFEDNEAYGSSNEYGPGSNAYGGALYIAGGTANINDTSFTGNVALGGDGSGLPDGTAFGGAIYVADGQVVMSNTTINGNSVNSIGDNRADVCYGGGLYVAGGTVTLANCTVDSNRAADAPTSYGGGLCIAGGTVTLTNDTVESNTATYGGGLYVAAGTLTLTNCTVQSNTATTYGGGIDIASAATVSIDPFTVANTVNNADSSGTNGSTANIDGTYILPPAAGQPPIVVHAASANPSPVTGTTTNLSVLGADAAGFSSLTYTWAVTSAPAGAATPTFSSNGSNAAQNTTATFYQAGTYTFQVTITDPSGLTVVSSVSVTVVQTVSSISITPGTVTVADGAKQQFTAVALDQFGQTMVVQPTFTWKVSSSSGGTISSTGLYTAPKKGTGTFEAEVSAGNQAIGGNAAVGPGGAAAGGGLAAEIFADTTLDNVTFTGNQALGGSGSSSPGYPGTGGSGFGGGFYNGVDSMATVSHAQFLGNLAQGGAGGSGATGGVGAGGAMANGGGAGAFEMIFLGLGTDTSSLAVDHSQLLLNVALGGAGGAGAKRGDGLGGGCYLLGTTSAVIDSTQITTNLALGGLPGTGGGSGQGIGGGLYIDTGASVVLAKSTTVAGNLASTSHDDIFGVFTTI